MLMGWDLSADVIRVTIESGHSDNVARLLKFPASMLAKPNGPNDELGG